MSESKKSTGTTELTTRVEGLDEKGRPRLLRVYYDDEQAPMRERKHHRIVKVQGNTSDFAPKS